MAAKKPEEFVEGDTIKNIPGTPYSGSKMTTISDMGHGRTQATFANGEIVEFFNGVQHEMQE